MNYKKLLTLLSLSALASSCSNSLVLEGERQELMLQAKSIQADPNIQGESVILTSPVTLNNWTMQGYNLTHTIPHARFSWDFKEVTSFNGGSASGYGKVILYTPLIQNDQLFVIDPNGRLRCFDIKTQKLLWEKRYSSSSKEQRSMSVTGMTIDGSVGYLSLSTDQGMAVSLDNGDVLWQKTLSDIARIPPRVHNGTVFYTNIDNLLDVRDAKTGGRKWAYQSIQEEAMLLGGASVSVTPTHVIAPFASGELVALNHEGGVVWNDQITSSVQGNIMNSIQHVYAPVVVDKHQLFVSSHAGSLISYNISTGRRAWEQPILTLQTPALSDAHMFVLDNQQRIICLKKASGQVKWVRQLKIAEDDFKVSEAPVSWYGPLLISNHLGVFASNGTVLMLDPNTGNTQKTITLNHQIAIAPIVVKDRCYIVTPKNDIIAYE